MQAGSVISLSPSFNRCCSSELAEIAARVVEEFGSDEYYEEFYFEREEDSATARTEEEEEEEDSVDVERERGSSDVVQEDDAVEDEEFEFPSVMRDSEVSSPISADEIFHNGQIRPVYPVFNRELFLGRMEFHNEHEKEDGARNSVSGKDAAIRLPLRKLFIEERETTITMKKTSSSSSSEGDELEGIPAETYCVWRPKEAAERRCKKSSSASNSKRWKLRDLMNRSHSDGSKGGFIVLNSANSGRRKQNEERVKAAPSGGGKAKSAAVPPPSPPPAPYNRDGREKRRSYLPYRQDLVGIFTNLHALSKN